MANLHVAPTDSLLSPVTLFLNADMVVKVVMVGLVLASIWTWAIIIGHGFRVRRLTRQSDQFERDFWAAEDIDRFHEAFGKGDRSTAGRQVDREGTRARLATAMAAAIAAEMDQLSDRLNILATVGSVAPFVGLFGTVWGIMTSFTDIAAQQNTSLGVVAPGIAEALFATALGLFAAIPAVVAYNRLGHRLNRYEAQLHRFADGFHATLSRELELEP